MKFRNCFMKYRVVPVACSMSVAAAFPAFATGAEPVSGGSITDMLGIFSQLFA